MSIYTTLDGGEPAFLASNTGWGDFARWVEAEHEGDVADLLHLVSHGWDEDLGRVEMQLQRLAEDRKPDPETAAVARALLESLAARSGATVLTVTDGLGPAGAAGTFAESDPGALLAVPDVPQHVSYDCGAAASMAVARFFGVGPEALDEWKKLLGTDPQDGTRPEAIVEVLRSLGLRAEPRHGMTLADLRAAWRAGSPVICPIQDYGPDAGPGDYDDGHYVVVVGGPALGHVFIQDSMQDVELGDAHSVAAPGRVMVGQRRFLDVWHDRGADGRYYLRFGVVVSRGK